MYSDQEVVQKLNPIMELWKIAKRAESFNVRLEATRQVLFIGNLLKKIPSELEEFFKYTKLSMESTMSHVNVLVSVLGWYLSHVLKKKKNNSSSDESQRDERNKEKLKHLEEQNKQDTLKKFESKINSLFIQENPSKYYKMESTIGSGG